MMHNAEAEAALLGAILTNNAAYHAVCRDLLAEHFYEPVHGRIYDGIGKLVDEGKQASPISLAAFFENDPALEKAGGRAYLFDLAASVVTVVNAPTYAATIIDMAQRRELILRCQDAIAELEDPDIESPASEIGTSLATGCSITINKGGGREMSRREVMGEVVETLKAPLNCDSTGFDKLDYAMAGGLHAGKAYAIYGRGKIGKSALLGSISYNLNEAGVKHADFCLEMGPVTYEERNMGRALGYNAEYFLTEEARRDTECLTAMANYAATAPDSTFYYDEANMPLQALRKEVAYLVNRHNIRGFILDYLQLVGGRPERRNMSEHMDEVAQWIAQVCKGFGIWALVAAQENQDGNIRSGEGARMAFNQIYNFQRASTDRERFLAMDQSRYTPIRHVGDKITGGLIFENAGPHFRDNEAVEDDRQQVMEELAGD